MVYTRQHPDRVVERAGLHAALARTCRRPRFATTSSTCSRRASWASGSRPTPSSSSIPSGSFALAGPSADCGVTGRKIIVDSYGGAGRHGGGAFSGKDPSKVDRSGAYYCRYVARRIVQAGFAQRAEVQVAYAIGRAKPMSVKVDTFGTGDAQQGGAVRADNFDFRPANIIEELDLLQPIYRQTTNYGHFGKAGLPWEKPVPAAV